MSNKWLLDQNIVIYIQCAWSIGMLPKVPLGLQFSFLFFPVHGSLTFFMLPLPSVLALKGVVMMFLSSVGCVTFAQDDVSKFHQLHFSAC